MSFELINTPYQYANDDLWDSIELDCLNGVEQALEDGADVNFQKDRWTPLQLAVYNGNTEIVKLLLEYGANPNMKGYGNQTALGYAEYWNRVKIAQILRTPRKA